MRGFWLLHLLGALVFTVLLGLYGIPDDRLPPKWTAPRGLAREGLTNLLAPWVVPGGAPPSEESAGLMRRIIEEKYEDSIASLEQERNRLQAQLKSKERQG